MSASWLVFFFFFIYVGFVLSLFLKSFWPLDQKDVETREDFSENKNVIQF